jgi:hypothetical protein
MTLEERIARLERANRRLRWGLALAFAAGAALVPRLVPRAQASGSQIDVEKLTVRDGSGKPRLVLSVEKSGAGLAFLAPDGKREGFLTVAAGEVGKTTVAETGAHNPGVYLYDRAGTLAWHAP